MPAPYVARQTISQLQALNSQLLMATLNRNSQVTEERDKEGGIPSVAVVICTHERPLLLECCLRRLEQVDYLDYSVVVVDSAPKSSQTKLLAARYNAKYEL